MKRVNIAEILDSDACPPEEIHASLKDMSLINRWFGGVATTQTMFEHIAKTTGKKRFSVLEVAAGLGEVPEIVSARLRRNGISLDFTLLDRAKSHLPDGKPALSRLAIAADALALPLRDRSFDLVNCSLFAHHLGPEELAQFMREAVRVSRHAVLINDLVRHRVHLALVYAGFPLMRSYVSRFDGVASVRKAYVPDEMRSIFSSAFPNEDKPRLEISNHYLFRMGAIVWRGAKTTEITARTLRVQEVAS